MEVFLNVIIIARQEGFVRLCLGLVNIALVVEFDAIGIALVAILLPIGSSELFDFAVLKTILYPLDLTNDLRSVD